MTRRTTTMRCSFRLRAAAAMRLVLAASLCAVAPMTAVTARADGEQLAIGLEAVGAPLTTARAPFRVTFRNAGTEPLNLLAIFEPIPVFFQFEIARSDGTPVQVPGGGKIDPPQGSEPYVALAPGATHVHELDLAPLLPAEGWASDTYTVFVRYRNAYGVGCFRGVIESEPISVRIEAAP